MKVYMSKQYWEEWQKLVQEAREKQEGTCPLIEDSVILAIDNYIKTLHNIVNGEYS